MNEEIINRQQTWWKQLRKSGLIDDKKYNNLIRRKMFETNDSQGTFRRRCFDESICMEVDGSLKICPNDSSFLTAENSKELQARFFEFDKKCYKCKYFSLCKGNCILLKKDKSGCAGYPMLFKTIQRSLKNGN